MNLDFTTQYQILGDVDISEYTDVQLYSTLESFYKSSYKVNDKIILRYFKDAFEYQDLPGRQLRKLIDYLNQLDIPLAFIFIVTSNKNFEKEFKQLSNDPIDFVVIDQDFDVVTRPASDTFCILPWMHLYVGTDSNVLPCCISDKQYPLGSINHSSIKDIVNNPATRQVRLNMLAGRRSKECSQCYLAEDSNVKSSRIGATATWDKFKFLAEKTAVDGSIDFVPYYLDIRLSNICNLKCRYCSGDSSSAIAQEDFELFGKKYELLTNSEKQTALTEICDEHLGSVEKIYFAGGEPLLMSEHYQILDKLVEIGRTDVEIMYNTNFTTLQFKDKNVIDIWPSFSNITVGASIDAYGNELEYARHGTSWANIEANLLLVQNICPNVKIKITSTANILTVESLITLQKTWHEYKGIPLEDFDVAILYVPETMCLQVLPVHHKDRIADLINQHIQWVTVRGANQLATAWADVITYMYTNDLSHMIPELKRTTTIRDQHRGESFNAVYPQFADL